MVACYADWTAETLAAEAAKYQTRAAFQRYANGAYTSALRRGVLDEVCAHMGSAYPMMDGPTTLYFLTVLSRCGGHIFYKVGLTKYDAKYRYTGEQAVYEVQAEILLPTRKAAEAEEKRLIRTYRQHLAPKDAKWARETKATELFTIDIYALERGQKAA
jgi:hypothetical protein